MGDTELVEAGYRRLQDEYNILRNKGHLLRKTTFCQWANGRILLTADETQAVFKERHAEYIDTKFYMVRQVLRRLQEKRLRAAVTYDKTQRMVVTMQLLVPRRV